MPDGKILANRAHHPPQGVRDRFAYAFVRFLRFFADAFFAGRYGHRAVVLETVAGVPGMVGGMLLHLKSLRRMESDNGWIQTLLDEAQNERMHLMTFVELARPTMLERMLILMAQGSFYAFYMLLYIVSPATAHRVVGYLEEEAVFSYSEYLECLENGELENKPAPEIAIRYWDLPDDARLHDVVVKVQQDEMGHREVNHCIANKIVGEDCSLLSLDGVSAEIQRKLNDCASRPAP